MNQHEWLLNKTSRELHRRDQAAGDCNLPDLPIGPDGTLDDNWQALSAQEVDALLDRREAALCGHCSRRLG